MNERPANKTCLDRRTGIWSLNEAYVRSRYRLEILTVPSRARSVKPEDSATCRMHVDGLSGPEIEVKTRAKSY